MTNAKLTRIVLICIVVVLYAGSVLYPQGLRAAPLLLWVLPLLWIAITWPINKCISIISGYKSRKKEGEDDTRSPLNTAEPKYVQPREMAIKCAVMITGLLLITLSPINRLYFMVPHTVPNGWTAYEYRKLAQRYIDVGMPKEAKDVLDRAVQLDPNGKDGILAKRYLTTKIPKHWPPEEALPEYKKISDPYVLDIRTRENDFVDYVHKYPAFEWAYKWLGDYYQWDGSDAKYKKYKDANKLAEQYLNKAIELNPEYVDAIVELAKVKRNEHLDSEARKLAARALELDPDCEAAKRLESKF